MRDKNGTTQHSIVERIGELAMTIPAAYCDGVLAKQPYFARLAAAEFDVKIEFAYTPGDAPRSWGFPEDWHDGSPAEVILKAIKADANVHFDNGDGISLTATRGTDLMPLFSHVQLVALEDRLLARAAAGSDE